MWLALRQMRVLTGWATLVEFPVCVLVGRDGFWRDRHPRRRLDRWRSRGELQAFKDPAGDGGVFDPTWGGFAPIQVGLTECVLSDIAENAVSYSYRLSTILQDLAPEFADHGKLIQPERSVGSGRVDFTGLPREAFGNLAHEHRRVFGLVEKMIFVSRNT